MSKNPKSKAVINKHLQLDAWHGDALSLDDTHHRK